MRAAAGVGVIGVSGDRELDLAALAPAGPQSRGRSCGHRFASFGARRALRWVRRLLFRGGGDWPGEFRRPGAGADPLGAVGFEVEPVGGGGSGVLPAGGGVLDLLPDVPRPARRDRAPSGAVGAGGHPGPAGGCAEDQVVGGPVANQTGVEMVQRQPHPPRLVRRRACPGGVRAAAVTGGDPFPEAGVEEDLLASVAQAVPELHRLQAGFHQSGGGPGDDGEAGPGRRGRGQAGQRETAGGQLFRPGRGYAGDGVGDEDPVVLRLREPAVLPVPGHRQRPVPKSGQPLSGGSGDVRVAVHGDHPGIPGDRAGRGRGHPGAGPDVQDALPRLQAQPLQQADGHADRAGHRCHRTARPRARHPAQDRLTVMLHQHALPAVQQPEQLLPVRGQVPVEEVPAGRGLVRAAAPYVRLRHEHFTA